MTDTAGNTATSTPVAPMRLRAEAPRVTRLSRKMLASVAAVALVGIDRNRVFALGWGLGLLIHGVVVWLLAPGSPLFQQLLEHELKTLQRSEKR